jgi:peroxin-4
VIFILHISVCEAILVLLGAGDSTSPLNCDAGNLLRSGDVMAYNDLARMLAIDNSFEED